MSQRVGGAVLLLVAVIILVLAQVSAGPDVPGTATRAPLPLPPPIGSCLSGPDNIVVPCDQPHEREVTFSWSADSAHSAGANRTQQCGDSAGTYLGMTIQTPGQGWFANGPQYLTNYIPAPLDERVGLLGWGACVVQGSLGETYLGSARGGAQEPAAYGSCFNGAPTDIIAPNVGCSRPHDLQILAYQTGFKADDPATPSLHPSPLPTNSRQVAGTSRPSGYRPPIPPTADSSRSRTSSSLTTLAVLAQSSSSPRRQPRTAQPCRPKSPALHRSHIASWVLLRQVS